MSSASKKLETANSPDLSEAMPSVANVSPPANDDQHNPTSDSTPSMGNNNQQPPPLNSSETISSMNDESTPGNNNNDQHAEGSAHTSGKYRKALIVGAAVSGGVAAVAIAALGFGAGGITAASFGAWAMSFAANTGFGMIIPKDRKNPKDDSGDSPDNDDDRGNPDGQDDDDDNDEDNDRGKPDGLDRRPTRNEEDTKDTFHRGEDVLPLDKPYPLITLDVDEKEEIGAASSASDTICCYTMELKNG